MNLFGQLITESKKQHPDFLATEFYDHLISSRVFIKFVTALLLLHRSVEDSRM